MAWVGGLFIAVTLFLPKGVIGAVPAFGAADRQSLFTTWRKRIAERRANEGGKA